MDETFCFDVTACSVTIAGVGGTAFVCRRRGSLLFQPTARSSPITLTGVHIAPEFPATFISESALVRKGCTITKCSTGGTVVSDTAGLLFKLEERDGLYYAAGEIIRPPANVLLQVEDALPDVPFHCYDTTAALSWLIKCDMGDKPGGADSTRAMLLAKTYSKRDVSDLLGRYHRRMSHMDFKRVAAAFGVQLPAGFEPPLCHACVIGKQRNIPHHEGAKLRATRACAGLHIDFCGPFPHTSRYGARYLLIFKCDFTKYIWDFYPQAQSEFFDILVALVTRLSNQFSVKNVVVWIRSDNGKVFTDGRVIEFCVAKGIRQEFSAPHSQWQNGSAETTFSPIMSLSTASLQQSGLVNNHWEDAVRLTVLCINRIGEPASSNVAKGFPEGYSRLERLHAAPIITRLNGIMPLGVLTYARVPGELRKKFEPRAVACLYLGLHETIKGVRLLQLDTNKTIVTAVFTVSEGHFPLMMATVATPSKEFMREHSTRDLADSPVNIWPVAPVSADFRTLHGAVDAVVPLPSSSTRPTRKWAPSAQALQNIATAADGAARRVQFDDETKDDGGDLPEEQPVLTMSVSSSSCQPLSDDLPDEILVFMNPVTPWIFETDDFLLGSISQTQGIFVTAVASTSSPVGIPCDRHEYLAQTPTTYARARASIPACVVLGAW